MKLIRILIATLLLISVCVSNSIAQDPSEWSLPEDAIARIGKGYITDIKYSPDGAQLAVGSSIGVWLYDANTGDELTLLTAHTKPVAAIAFSPNGDKLVSGSYDRTLCLWNPYTGELLKTLKTDGRIATVVFSPDGRTLANGNGNKIQLWDVDTAQHKTTIHRRGSSIFFLLFSPDGRTLASASLSDKIQLWDPRTGQHKITFGEKRDGSTTSITFSPSGPRLAFSPDGKTLASTAVENRRNINKKINLWNTDTGELLTTLAEDEQSFTYPVSTVQFSADGTTLISGSQEGTLRMWDLKTGESSTPFGKAEYGAFLMPPFMPDSTTLVRVTPDNTIHLSDTRTGETRLTLTEHIKSIGAVAFSVDDTTLATVSDDNTTYDTTVQLWNLRTRRRTAILEAHESRVSSVLFLPDGLTLASKSIEEIFLWDVQTDRPKNTFTGNGRGVFAASPDGRIFANENGHSIRLLNAYTGEHQMTLWGHTGYITSVAFSPDSATLASGSEPTQASEKTGAMIRLWDTKTGNQRLAFVADEHKVSAVAFSTDGETLASTRGPIIQLWNVNTGKRKASLTAYPDDARHRVYIRALAFSPDGKTFVSGGEGEMHSRENYHLIHVWDVETGKHLNTLTGHSGGVRSLAYSTDGMTLVSGSLDGTMLVWKMAPTPTAHVSISPRAIEAPNIGEKLTFNLDISKGQDITGYQFTLQYDATALQYVSTTNGDYLKGDVHVTPPIVHENSVTLATNTDDAVSTGDGVLASVTFKVLTRNALVLKLVDVRLSNAQGNPSSPIVHRGWVTEPPRIPADVNHDWRVDAADLKAVSSRLGQTGKGNSADVNNDGLVDIADLVLVTKALSHPTPVPAKD